MSRSCKSIQTNAILATSFFGGPDRGKVVQLHMAPEDLEMVLGVPVYDTESELVSFLGEWLRVECANASMVLFDRFAPPKVSSIAVTSF